MSRGVETPEDIENKKQIVALLWEAPPDGFTIAQISDALGIKPVCRVRNYIDTISTKEPVVQEGMKYWMTDFR